MAAKAISGRRRGRWLAGLALVVAVGVVTGVVLRAGSPSRATSASHPGKVSGAATVRRRDLIETDTESGTLSYRNPQTVFNRLSGTITWLPSVGRMIKPGQTLYRVDSSPVILMDGTTPAFRTLTFGVSDGPDVLQLNRDLVKLGFNPDGITINDTWQGATTAGADQLQESLGRPQTGTLSLGQIVFLPGEQRITAVDTTLGSTGSGGSGGSGTGASSPASTSTTVPTATPELVSLEAVHPASPGPKPPAGARSRRGPKRRKADAGKPGRLAGSVSQREIAALIALLRAETAQLKAERRSSSTSGHSPTSTGGHRATSSGSIPKSSSGSGSAGGAGKSSGSGEASASAILQTTSTQLVVSVGLDATKQSEAVVGEGVMVEMPSGNSVPGKITAVSPVAQSSSNSSSGASSGGGGGGSGGASATIPVTITLRGHQTGARLDQAAVSVDFSQAKADNVLSVPVTALLATAGGGYAVQEVATPHQLVPVTIGLFAAGYVQISGAGIYPGLLVTDSQG
jgi:hypothetical protein